MRRKLPYDLPLITVVLLLLGFGLVMVFSSSAMVSQDRYGSASGILFRQMIAVMLGLLALLAAMKINYQRLCEARAGLRVGGPYRRAPGDPSFHAGRRGAPLDPHRTRAVPAL